MQQAKTKGRIREAQTAGGRAQRRREVAIFSGPEEAMMQIIAPTALAGEMELRLRRIG